METKPSAQSLFKIFEFRNSSKKWRKNGYQTFLFLSNTTGFLYFVPNILSGIVVNYKYIKKCFAEIVKEKESKPYGIVSDDVLHDTIELLIKVWSFTTARDYVQRHRCLKKGTKKKALRTKLKR